MNESAIAARQFCTTWDASSFIFAFAVIYFNCCSYSSGMLGRSRIVGLADMALHTRRRGAAAGRRLCDDKGGRRWMSEVPDNAAFACG